MTVEIRQDWAGIHGQGLGCVSCRFRRAFHILHMLELPHNYKIKN